ncbi:iron chelate uptake ABC transporter family permease subunit [Desulfogranum marinum]|uniref:metal ABC transporter permease n=1 Tax=Desulfogranum marinum TaxID=453220 RepID=UPI0029C8061A|nr:iron chelate uptake ABC transporter family permease subunit [Desulfogranum marinum]
MYDLFIAPLAETYFQKALIGGSIVAVVAGVVGCLVVLKRMAFLGDALSHAMIAGVAGGYLVMKLLFGAEAHAPGMLLGSLIAAIATVALISFVSRISRVKEDTAIGIMYTGIFALGVVAVSIFRHYIHIDLMHFIMGDVLGVADSDLWVSAFVAAFVLTLLILFFRHFQLATFDPVMAASIGLPVLLIDYVLTTCVSLVVVSAVSMVGVILVVGLLITPAATAYLLSDRLDRMMWLAALFGVTSVVGGLYLCVWLDSAGGGAIMLFCTLQFLVVLAVAPKYGLLARWRRMRNLVPQQVIEDILTTILRHGKTTPMEVIRQYVESGGKGIKKALLRMIQDGLITSTAGGYDLTADGEKEANKVLRAHRLWEAYLDTIGTPEEQLHPTAHHLEHISDTNTVDYLDEKLGHLDHDPHGQPIP